MSAANSLAIQAWNTVLYEKFFRFKHLLVHGLSQHSDTALMHAAYPHGARVLDIGCGFGDSTLQIAGMVGTEGTAVGLDCAENFVGAAEAARMALAITNARFLVRDVQSEDLGGRYDHAFSRFGTMFFDNPGAAMRNVRAALQPGGTLTQIVWRRRQDNAWLHEAELSVREIVPANSQDTDQVHCGPGPFSMADADMITTLLQSAGFDRVSFERHDCPICIGRDLAEAIEFAMALGPAGEIIRLAGAEGVSLLPKVHKALERTLSRFVRPDGVWAPSSTWFVRSRNPR